MALLRQYFTEFVLTPPRTSFFSSAAEIRLPDFEKQEGFDGKAGLSDAELNDIATRIEGFSAREISKLCLGWQAAAYGGSQNSVLSREMVDDVVDIFVKQHKFKEEWRAESAAELEEELTLA